MGNRTNSHRSSAYSYQPTNRLTSTSTATYTYDANGNLTAKTDSSGTWQYQWDTENRLVQVRRGSLTVSYKYDALGRRIEQSAGGGWLRFSYDGADVAVDRAGYGAQTFVTTEYTNGLGVDEKLSQRMSSGQGSVTLYYVADHQVDEDYGKAAAPVSPAMTMVR